MNNTKILKFTLKFKYIIRVAQEVSFLPATYFTWGAL
jgi:hypothetical protein